MGQWVHTIVSLRAMATWSLIRKTFKCPPQLWSDHWSGQRLKDLKGFQRELGAVPLFQLRPWIHSYVTFLLHHSPRFTEKLSEMKWKKRYLESCWNSPKDELNWTWVRVILKPTFGGNGGKTAVLLWCTFLLLCMQIPAPQPCFRWQKPSWVSGAWRIFSRGVWKNLHNICWR